ncbi:hypothetical protein [Nocardioides cynanchi]|nr:hypothetical protein [Nocardioides cynanchi]
MNTTPKVTVTEDLPEGAWLIIERPTGETSVVGGSDSAVTEALAYGTTA